MSTHDELPTIDLNALVRPVARIKLDDTLYEVLPIQGDAITVLEQASAMRRARIAAGSVSQTDDEATAMVVREIEMARRVVFAVAPTIPTERVKTMMIGQLMAIAEMAADPVRRVREVIQQAEGKGGGPVRKVARTRSGRK